MRKRKKQVKKEIQAKCTSCVSLDYERAPKGVNVQQNKKQR